MRSIIHLGTLGLVEAKIEVDVAETAADVADAIDAAEARVRQVVPTATRIYLEPDLRRSTGVS